MNPADGIARAPERPQSARIYLTAPVVRRDPGSVQIGLAPEEGVILAGLTPAETRLLLRLQQPMSVASVRRSAAAGGRGRQNRVDEIFRLLDERRLLGELRPTTGTDPVGRAAGTVLVTDDGLLTHLIADALRGGGVRRVEVGDPAAQQWMERLLDGPRPALPEPPAPPRLVVLVADLAASAEAAEVWRRCRVAHLSIVRTGRAISVGPTVVAGGPCLSCLDSHRTDSDPSWPSVRAQLLAAGRAAVPIVGAVGTDRATTTVAAGWAATMALMHLDGTPPPAGSCLEVSAGRLGAVYRRWSRHPRCECWTLGRQ